MPYHIISLAEYEKSINDLENVEQQRIERFIVQIRENGMLVGKRLRFPFFREKKFNGKRLYFLIYEEWKTALLARVSTKKQQDETINWIVENLPELKKYVEQKLREMGII